MSGRKKDQVALASSVRAIASEQGVRTTDCFGFMDCVPSESNGDGDYFEEPSKGVNQEQDEKTLETNGSCSEPDAVQHNAADTSPVHALGGADTSPVHALGGADASPVHAVGGADTSPVHALVDDASNTNDPMVDTLRVNDDTVGDSSIVNDDTGGDSSIVQDDTGGDSSIVQDDTGGESSTVQDNVPGNSPVSDPTLSIAVPVLAAPVSDLVTKSNIGKTESEVDNETAASSFQGDDPSTHEKTYEEPALYVTEPIQVKEERKRLVRILANDKTSSSGHRTSTSFSHTTPTSSHRNKKPREEKHSQSRWRETSLSGDTRSRATSRSGDTRSHASSRSGDTRSGDTWARDTRSGASHLSSDTRSGAPHLSSDSRFPRQTDPLSSSSMHPQRRRLSPSHSPLHSTSSTNNTTVTKTSQYQNYRANYDTNHPNRPNAIFKSHTNVSTSSAQKFGATTDPRRPRSPFRRLKRERSHSRSRSRSHGRVNRGSSKRRSSSPTRSRGHTTQRDVHEKKKQQSPQRKSSSSTSSGGEESVPIWSEHYDSMYDTASRVVLAAGMSSELKMGFDVLPVPPPIRGPALWINLRTSQWRVLRQLQIASKTL